LLEFRLEPSPKDHLNIGVAEGARVTIQSPTFSQEKAAWECVFSIKGSENEFHSSLYGISELQAVELVIGFLDKMFS
jgi:Domain of unknown function (DUF6968)